MNHRKSAAAAVAVVAIALTIVASSGLGGVSAGDPPQAQGDAEVLERGGVPDSLRTRDAIWSEFRNDVSPFVDDGDTGQVDPIDGQESGFASFIVNEADLSADIHWKGDPPAELLTIIAQHPNVTVALHENSYSLAERISARDTVSDMRNELIEDGILIQRVGPATDGSGLLIEATPITQASQRSSEDAGKKVEKNLEKLLGVPLDVQIDEKNRTTPFSGSHQDDKSAFTEEPESF